RQWVQNLLFGDSGKLIQRIAGIFIIGMGLFIAGWINIPFLMKEKRMQSKGKPAGYVGTFFIGLGFAAGWRPCIGARFGSIRMLANLYSGLPVFLLSLCGYLLLAGLTSRF